MRLLDIIIVAAGTGTAYTPAELTSDLSAGVATVLPWVGAGIGGGVVLMFAFMGIRKGFQFFRGIGK